MQLLFSTLCKNADISHDGQFLHLFEAGIGGVLVDKLPAKLITITFAARIAIEKDDSKGLGEQVAVRLSFKEPDGTYISGQFGQQMVDVPLRDPDDALDTDPAISVVIAVNGMPITAVGRYVFELHVNDQLISSLPLGVRMVQPKISEEKAQ